MPEPMIPAYSTQFEGRPFTRSGLRHRMGPDDPLFHLLEDLCFQDVVGIFDDFTTSLDTTLWTATAIAGGVAHARSANVLSGVILGSGTTTSGDGSRLFMANNEIFVTNARPYALIRHRPAATITTSKFEFGFSSADTEMVNSKVTPTSTTADYAAIIRDTDDSTSTDLIVDGTTPAIAKVVGSAALTTLAASTYQVWMLALNEQNAAYYWINGIFGGVQRGNGPDDDVTLGISTTVRTRADATLISQTIDYIKAGQERIVF